MMIVIDSAGCSKTSKALSICWRKFDDANCKNVQNKMQCYVIEMLLQFISKSFERFICLL